MDYERKTKQLITANRILKRIVGAFLIVTIIFIGSMVYDMFAFTDAGKDFGDFPGFSELMSRNPDTVAWIKMDGTHINHPVVQGEDNFEYINKDFDGNFYQGGAIFLDAGNAGDFSDDYIIIHGHHMSRGAMFSDVVSYTEEEFFERNSTGELITPAGCYDLTVVAVKHVDAYEGELYYVAPDVIKPLHLIEGSEHRRDVEFEDGDKLVLLSTCAGDMTTARVVLFCRARKTEARYGNQARGRHTGRSVFPWRNSDEEENEEQ